MKPVFVFAVGFWLIGSFVCYSFAALDAFVKADAATIAPPLRASAPYLRFVCLGLGLILGLFNAFLPRVGFVALARRVPNAASTTSTSTESAAPSQMLKSKEDAEEQVKQEQLKVT